MGYEECTLCGLCRVNCPIWKARKKEGDSPRGKALLLKAGIHDEIFYACTLCGSCKEHCPIGVDLGLKAQRKALNDAGIQTAQNKAMIKNVRKHGNPFGDGEDDTGELYCC